MHRATSRWFLYLSMLYAFACGCFTWAIHPDGLQFVSDMGAAAVGQWFSLWKSAPVLCTIIPIATIAVLLRFAPGRLPALMFSFAGCAFFMWGFTMFKLNMPRLLDFWADPMFASLDQALHFGHHPWALIEPLRSYIPPSFAGFVYFKLWLWPGVVGPLVIVLLDNNEARVARFFSLYVFSWLILGNLLALLFLSVGPVYYDRLLGTEVFTGLTTVLSTPQEAGSVLGVVRQLLWDLNFGSMTDSDLVAGISAFPSLHVAIATITCLYLCEISRLAAPGRWSCWALRCHQAQATGCRVSGCGARKRL